MIDFYYCQPQQQTNEHNEYFSSIESPSTTMMMMKPKYLNRHCDFENIPARGCHLRESYCSLHTCICKPDFPINIDDRLCLARLKSIGDQCEYNQECQNGSICANDGTKTKMKICRCKIGYVYSAKNRQCIKGLKGANCTNDDDCFGDNLFCSMISCECKYGYQWSSDEENCLKRSKFGELCDTSINCKVYDEFSECDLHTKRCVCGEFLSRKYTLDELTRRCISCPMNRLNHTSNTCLPEKTTVEYSLLDRTADERKSLQYGIYIALSMAPFFIFALIGFIYRYVNPYGTLEPETMDHCASRIIDENGHGSNTTTTTTTTINNHTADDLISPSSHYCLSIDFDNSAIMDQIPFSFAPPPPPLSTANIIICDNSQQQQQPQQQNSSTAQISLPPEPPPSYDLASQDMPPSYDEVIRQEQQQQQQMEQRITDA